MIMNLIDHNKLSLEYCNYSLLTYLCSSSLESCQAPRGLQDSVSSGSWTNTSASHITTKSCNNIFQLHPSVRNYHLCIISLKSSSSSSSSWSSPSGCLEVKRWNVICCQILKWSGASRTCLSGASSDPSEAYLRRYRPSGSGSGMVLDIFFRIGNLFSKEKISKQLFTFWKQLSLHPLILLPLALSITRGSHIDLQLITNTIDFL